MPFNAGELVATIRGDRTALTRELAGARNDLNLTGKSADAMAGTIAAAGARAAKGPQAVSAAAKESARAVKDAGTASEQAASKTAAANEKTAASSKRAGAAATEAGAAAQAASGRQVSAAEQARRATEKNADAQKTLGVGLTAYGAAAVGAFGVVLKLSSDFQSKQAQLQSLSGANASQMQQEAEAALTLGQSYGFTASQVSDAEIELQKAGQGVEAQLNGGLKGALVGAAAGQMDVADATSIAVTAMTQFRLGSDSTEHVMDLLAAGSDKALGSMKDLGDGLKQGGLVASQMGLSLEDTTGTLAAFANAGLIGSDAGTSLKTMLLSLQSPSSQAQKQLDKLGISAYDAQGSFVGITNLAGQLAAKLHDKSQAERDAALSTIFGSDAIRSANVLYNEGAKGLQGWIDKVNDSGFAAEQAAGKQNSFAGASQKLAAAIQTDLIRAGSALLPVLQPIVTVLAQGAQAAGTLPAPLVGAGVAMAGLTGALALGTGAFALLLPRILETRAALVTASAAPGVLGKAARGATAGISGLKAAGSGAASFFGGPWGLALAVAGAAITAWQMAVDAAKASPDELAAAAGRGADGIDLLVAAAARGQNVAVGPLQWIATLGQSADVETDVLKNLNSQLDTIAKGRANPLVALVSGTPALAATGATLSKIGETLATLASTDGPKAAQSFEALAKQTDGSDRSLKTLLDSMPAYRDALAAQATEMGHLTGKETESQRTKILLAQASEDATNAGKEQASAAEQQASSIAAIQGSAVSAAQSVTDLANQIKGLGSTTLDQRSSERAFQSAIDEAEKALAKNGRTLDDTTEKGRANAQALDNIASSGTAAAAAIVANGGSTKDAAAAVSDARAKYIKWAEAMGSTKADAKKLADQVGLIPTNVELLLSANDSDAQEKIKEAKAAAKELAQQRYALQIDLEVSNLDSALAKAGVSNHAQVAKNARISAFAVGGRIPGIDRGVDSEVIVARPGEHMLTVDDVAAMGGHSAVYGFRAALHGYAKGGAIKPPTPGTQAAYDAEQAKIQATIDAQEKTLKSANAKAKRAEAAATKAADASAAIYGKGTGPAKHAAAQRAREARKRSDDAAKAAKSAQDRLSALQDSLTRAQSRDESAQDLRTSISQGQTIDPSSPFGAVSLGFQEARDSNLSAGQRKTIRNTTATQNANLAKYAKSAEDAQKATDAASTALDQAKSATDNAIESYRHQKTAVENATDAVDAATKSQQDAQGALESLQSQFSSLVSSVASNVRSLFSLGNAVTDETTKQTSITHNAGTGAAWDEMVTTTVPGGATLAGIRSEIDSKSTTFSKFSGMLTQLAAMGYAPSVITDVANLGADAGGKVAAALLTAGSGDVAAINSGYSSIASSTTAIGTTVANGELSGQISDAQRAVQVANDQLATANAQLKQAQDAEISNLQAQQAVAQSVYDNAVRTQNSINAQITTAQKAIVDAVTKALTSGQVTKKALGSVSHEPQITGSPILWGEAGPEAYIPLSNDSRRPRALALLDETARRLGQVVLPSGTETRALGGISSTVSTSSSSTDYGDINLNGPMFGTPEDIIGAAEKRQALRRARANAVARIGRVNP